MLYRKNIPVIIRNLGSTGNPSLSYTPMAHSVTLAHPEESYRQAMQRSRDDNEVHPKDQGKGGVEDAAIPNYKMGL